VSKVQKIVVVGGGAGGLELVALLSRKLNKAEASLTLVDGNLKHVWKPLLHEVATGTLDSHEEVLDYIPYANKHGFSFIYGHLKDINRSTKELIIGSVPAEVGDNFIPERTISYDMLVIAIGSLSNDFNIPGVREHCLFLDTVNQAEIVQGLLINEIIQQVQVPTKKPLNIAIIGAGATGIELAAEIHYAIKQSQSNPALIQDQNNRISVIEGKNRITPHMPEAISVALTQYLIDLGINVLVDEQVSSITKEAVHTASGQTIVADIKIWAAGIKADSLLKNLDGLEVNALNQLVVKKSLQTTLDDAIFALGDCAFFTQINRLGELEIVPPSAQAAHQQAYLLASSIRRFLNGKSLLDFTFVNHGSLITANHSKVVGYLMGKFTSRHVEGWLARLIYLSVHKQHQIALHGYWRTLLVSIANVLTRKGRARLKLH
jgi:NADH dehydrogenase